MPDPTIATTETPLVSSLRRHPFVINPHIRMCAVITAVLHGWGSKGERILRNAYRDLGHKTGQYMIATGIVAKGADLETYGRVSEQIMDVCGLDGWTRLDTASTEHRTVVPNCAKYTQQYQAMNAPKHLCAIPFEWDNGCLDAINPSLRILPEMCRYVGDLECHYVIRDDQAYGTTTDSSADASVSITPITRVDQAPAWTNPQAGLLAITARALEHLTPNPYGALIDAMQKLGKQTGAYLLESGLVPANAGPSDLAKTAAAIGHLSGYPNISIEQMGRGTRLKAPVNPYRPVVEAFGHAADVSAITQQWEVSWISAVNPASKVSVEKDGLVSSGGDQRLFTTAHSAQIKQSTTSQAHSFVSNTTSS